MSWVHIDHGHMADSLNHLRSEVVFNAVSNMVQRPDITSSELRDLLDIIEQEVIAIHNVDNTCVYEPNEFFEGKVWYVCNKCGGKASADYDPPSYCPHCGRKIEQGDKE